MSWGDWESPSFCSERLPDYLPSVDGEESCRLYFNQEILHQKNPAHLAALLPARSSLFLCLTANRILRYSRSLFRAACLFQLHSSTLPFLSAPTCARHFSASALRRASLVHWS